MRQAASVRKRCVPSRALLLTALPLRVVSLLMTPAQSLEACALAALVPQQDACDRLLSPLTRLLPQPFCQHPLRTPRPYLSRSASLGRQRLGSLK